MVRLKLIQNTTAALADALAIDSINFPQVRDTSWGYKRKTEIVTLRTGAREISTIDTLARNLLCGRPPTLRPCHMDDPAILAHRSCDISPARKGDFRLGQWVTEASQRPCTLPDVWPWPSATV